MAYRSSHTEEQISQETFEVIQDLLRRGQLQSVVSRVQDEIDAQADASWEPTTHGAMHDGSKRRLIAGESSGDHGFELVSAACVPMPSSSPGLHGQNAAPMSVNVQHPIPPMQDKGKPAAVALPPGISSIAEWGATICTLPKVKGRKIRYQEMLDESRSSKAMSEYLQWIKTSGVKSAKVDDLKAFMSAAGFNPESVSGGHITYPGTTIQREF